jgi:hypothetical protein
LYPEGGFCFNTKRIVCVQETLVSAAMAKGGHHMQPATERGQQSANDKTPPFFVNIEGVEYPWDKETITTEEIIQLGGWDPSLGVIEIDKDNNERTLQPGEVVELKPGHGFGKKIRWKRG